MDLETYLFRDNKNQGNTGFAKKSLNVYPAANKAWMNETWLEAIDSLL